jgi:isoquinoline 1-oxidoreductase beta subunit
MHTALADDAAALPGRAIFGAPYDKARTLAALAGAPQHHEWTYEVPFLAHAALEPLSATAWWREGSCEVWAPTQQPDKAREAIAQLTGLPMDKCQLHTTFIGGGFGRKWELDFIRQAVQIAMQVRERPVKLTWTREQDFAHDRFRPAHMTRTRVALSKEGKILAMHSRGTGISMWKYHGRPPIPGYADPFATGLLINDRYQLGERYVDFVETDIPIPVGTWRSVSLSMNCFFSESVVDDVAAITHRDPLALRRELAAAEPRLLAVLNKAAELAGWDQPLRKGQGRGIALNAGFGSYCAQVVQVRVQGKRVHIERIVAAFDCGTVIDPGNVQAQVEGGIVWGLSAARDGQINFAKGAATQTNFHTAPVLRMNQMPLVEVHLLASAEKPGGAGEASVPPVAPALASAIHAATGKRPRRLPLIADGYQFV